MRTITKIITTILLAILVFSGEISNAESASRVDSLEVTSIETPRTAEYLELAARNLSEGLMSDVPGIMESSLYNALRFQKSYPGYPVPGLLSKVEILKKQAPSQRVRYKAHLIYLMLQSDELWETVAGELEHGETAFYRALAGSINEEFLIYAE